jgi:hypothetical protein
MPAIRLANHLQTLAVSDGLKFANSVGLHWRSTAFEDQLRCHNWLEMIAVPYRRCLLLFTVRPAAVLLGAGWQIFLSLVYSAPQVMM